MRALPRPCCLVVVVAVAAVAATVDGGGGHCAGAEERWPCSGSRASAPNATVALLRRGLEAGLSRLHARLSAPADPVLGNNPNVIGVLGGALAELMLNSNATAAEALIKLAMGTQQPSGALSWLPHGPAPFYDPHGSLLGLQQLSPLLHGYGHMLDPAFLRALRPRLQLAMEASWSCGSDLTYTNIVLGRVANNVSVPGQHRPALPFARLFPPPCLSHHAARGGNRMSHVAVR